MGVVIFLDIGNSAPLAEQKDQRNRKFNMHYQNKAEAKVGDIVIGCTFNSKNRVRIGEVIKLMPEQGSCNVELLIFGFSPRCRKDGDGGWQGQFVGSEFLTTVRSIEDSCRTIEVAVDYADASELLRVKDCYRMLISICKYGGHDSPYFKDSYEF